MMSYAPISKFDNNRANELTRILLALNGCR